MTPLKQGETATCRKCGKVILGPGGWGISPNAVCGCSDPERVSSVPQGCICPPGSETTCKGLMCPRRPTHGLGMGR